MREGVSKGEREEVEGGREREKWVGMKGERKFRLLREVVRVGGEGRDGRR